MRGILILLEFFLEFFKLIWFASISPRLRTGRFRQDKVVSQEAYEGHFDSFGIFFGIFQVNLVCKHIPSTKDGEVPAGQGRESRGV